MRNGGGGGGGQASGAGKPGSPRAATQAGRQDLKVDQRLCVALQESEQDTIT